MGTNSELKKIDIEIQLFIKNVESTFDNLFRLLDHMDKRIKMIEDKTHNYTVGLMPTKFDAEKIELVS